VARMNTKFLLMASLAVVVLVGKEVDAGGGALSVLQVGDCSTCKYECSEEGLDFDGCNKSLDEPFLFDCLCSGHESCTTNSKGIQECVGK